MSDLIERQEAIDALESGKDKTAKGDIGGFYNTIIQNDIDKLRNMPSAQSETCAYWDRESNICALHRPSAQQNLQLTCNQLATDSISRQAAIDANDAAFWETKNKKHYTKLKMLQSHAFLVETALKKLPSAQPEIIRCKDCKWYKTNYSWNGKEHKVCVIEPYEPIRKGDDFCSRGERRTDEAD